MGRPTMPGTYRDKDGIWHVDKVYKGSRLRRDFGTDQGEAEGWLITELAKLRETKADAARGRYKFEFAAAHYLAEKIDAASAATEAYNLERIMPYIGGWYLDGINNDALKPVIKQMLASGGPNGRPLKTKSVNLSIGTVRRIVRLAATEWRDERQRLWLQAAPPIDEIELTDQRPPMPISWSQQRNLLPKLPDHQARMGLFVLNTGARNNVVCNLRWEWEVWIEELQRSLFRVPKEYVKGRKSHKWLILNSVAQSVVESVRGMHPEFVFVYSQRVKSPLYRPIQTMYNTAWINACQKARLRGLHVHDLRHTVGMRLREAGVREETRDDILWHSRKTMTAHYGVAQAKELIDALELVTSEQNRVNRTLDMIAREQGEKRRSAA